MYLLYIDMMPLWKWRLNRRIIWNMSAFPLLDRVLLNNATKQPFRCTNPISFPCKYPIPFPCTYPIHLHKAAKPVKEVKDTIRDGGSTALHYLKQLMSCWAKSGSGWVTGVEWIPLRFLWLLEHLRCRLRYTDPAGFISMFRKCCRWGEFEKKKNVFSRISKWSLKTPTVSLAVKRPFFNNSPKGWSKLYLWNWKV